jgi:hypothetical protein
LPYARSVEIEQQWRLKDVADYNSSHDSEEKRVRQHTAASERTPEPLIGSLDAPVLTPSAVLSLPDSGGRGNLPVRAATLKGLQATHGNRAVQRFAGGASPDLQSEQDDRIARAIETQSSAGGKLDAQTRERLEDALGADLSGVRVHTGSDADMLSRSLGATAFTTGQDVFFREGMYKPHDEAGLRLLAHELTHTVQQAAGPVAGTPAEGGVAVSDPSDSFEQEAERVSDAVISGKGGALGPGRPSLQRSILPEEAPVQRFWDGLTDYFGGGGGSGPFYNPTPPMPQMPSSGPFYNPTPQVDVPGINAPGPLPLGQPFTGGPAFEEYLKSIWGKEPAKPGEAPRGHAYGKVDHEMGNAEGGFSLFSGAGNIPIPGIGDVPASVDYLYGSGKTGMWKNEDGGGTRVGTAASVGINKWNIGKGTPFSFDAGVGTASAEGSGGTDGFTGGLQANLVEGAVTLGNFGNKTDDGKALTNESNMRMGLSAGVGAAGRLHWGDSDGDKQREYGFGFDYGPVSFDYKTEDPMRTGLAAVLGGIAGPGGVYAADKGLEWLGGDTNYTDKTIDAGKAAYQAGSDAYNWAGKNAADLGSKAYDYGSKAYDAAGDTLNGIGSSAYEYGSAAYNTAGETLNSVGSAAYDYGSEAYGAASDFVNDISVPDVSLDDLKFW